MSENTAKPVIKKLASKVRTTKRKFVGVITATVLGLVAAIMSSRSAKRNSSNPHRNKH